MEEPQNGASPAPEKKNNTKLIVIIGLVILGLLLLNSLFSPERMTERMMESAMESAMEGEFDVDFDKDGSMEVSGKGDNDIKVSTGAAAKLPNTWPASVPILPGSNIEYAASIKESGSNVHTATFSTKSSLEDVETYYKDKLSKDGWEIQAVYNDGSSVMINSTRNDGADTVTIMSSADDEGTSITITAQAE